MAIITIPELRPIGYELFQDSETFLDELSDDWELEMVNDVMVSMAISNAINWQNPFNGFLTDSKMILTPMPFDNEGIPSLH
ncbi:MAG TPA: hypothetical protein V6D11_03005 [Waterburya sp.]